MGDFSNKSPASRMVYIKMSQQIPLAENTAQLGFHLFLVSESLFYNHVFFQTFFAANS